MLKRIVLSLVVALGVASAQVVPRPATPLNLLKSCSGRVILLAFIVTTCPHCKAFTRDVMEPENKAGHVCAVAIAFDAEGDTARFAQEQKLTFPVYKLERAVALAFLGLPDRRLGTPQVVVIDKKGMIQAQSAPQGSPLLMQPDVIRQIVERLR
jgi:peroxiredoxin